MVITRKLTHRFAVVAVVVVAVAVVGHGEATHSQEEHRAHKVGQNLGLDTDCNICKLDLNIHRKRGYIYSIKLEVLMMI